MNLYTITQLYPQYLALRGKSVYVFGQPIGLFSMIPKKEYLAVQY